MKINYEQELNPAQLKAVTTVNGPLLVIAGAGSGKTRTIVYRLAYLMEHGIDPSNILLLTFTRKAAAEMLKRVEELLGQDIIGICGGTFHSFAFSMLKKFANVLGWQEGFSIIDTSDALEIIRQAKNELNLTKDKKFPKHQTIYEIISRSRNKELPLEQIIKNQYYHLSLFTNDILEISNYYKNFKAKHFLVDYDDLLFFLEQLLNQDENVRFLFQQKFQFVMVDEYQDTNKIQGRLIKLLAGDEGNVMAVGDDAQSIYAFRGATIENILNFPKLFPNAQIIKLEQNYRSTQPILSLANHVLSLAKEKYPKKLFSSKDEGIKPELYYTNSDFSQAQLVTKKIQELSLKYPYREIAVLFRAGYQSYALEMELGKVGLKFQKFGGQKFSEAAHIKDIIAFLRIVSNASDVLAWTRALSNIKGVGPKTCQKLYQYFIQGETSKFKRICAKNNALKCILESLDELRQKQLSPQTLLEEIIKIYTPIMENKFMDDLPKRMAGVEQLIQIASTYEHLEDFLADLTLEPTNEEKRDDNRIVLSTIHSAKGLEWSCVLIIDLIEDKFPSKYALEDPVALEEERRLFYVACTRAKEYLALFVPTTTYNKYFDSFEPVLPSPFITEIKETLVNVYKENFFGDCNPYNTQKNESESLNPKTLSPATKKTAVNNNRTGAYCSHKIFGQGKIIAHIPPNKYKVHFPKCGLKTVIKDFLEFE